LPGSIDMWQLRNPSHRGTKMEVSAPNLGTPDDMEASPQGVKDGGASL
jgi:hypothetical protein